MIKVLIADDHILIREGFKKILSSESDMLVVGEAKDAFEALEYLEHQCCDIIVLDITMPGKSGLDLLGDIRLRFPDIKVLILSMHDEESYALRALKAGASGYLTKETAPEELIRAIRKIIDGRLYISQNVAEQLAANLGGRKDQLPHESLSDREFQVLHMLAKGRSIGDIATTLSLSPSTVSTYRQRIAEKLHVHSTAEMILYAVNNGLID